MGRSTRGRPTCVPSNPESRELLLVRAARGPGSHCDGRSNARAAHSLRVHRNTLRPLRERLERLLTVDLADPRQRAVVNPKGEI
ncbi:helix-turn-helix domain-containing protein [Brevibacterium sp. BRM-1]|uniref:helix-turn-helix domain-containing protein n=1 Tax=Brevibacterium sp. BRM-1 TaxID=2999062 RepID=UPI003FA40FEE